VRDLAVVQTLTAARVPFALIGAHACAVWGYARYTADLGLLTLDGQVLARAFWPPDLRADIVALRRGDDDPRGGSGSAQPRSTWWPWRGSGAPFSRESAAA
jgi:hypothetical protein